MLAATQARDRPCKSCSARRGPRAAAAPLLQVLSDMDVRKEPGCSNFPEAFERALDKGIVIDAHERVAQSGIDVCGADALVVVAVWATFSAPEPRPTGAIPDDPP